MAVTRCRSQAPRGVPAPRGADYLQVTPAEILSLPQTSLGYKRAKALGASLRYANHKGADSVAFPVVYLGIHHTPTTTAFTTLRPRSVHV